MAKCECSNPRRTAHSNFININSQCRLTLRTGLLLCLQAKEQGVSNSSDYIHWAQLATIIVLSKGEAVIINANSLLTVLVISWDRKPNLHRCQRTKWAKQKSRSIKLLNHRWLRKATLIRNNVVVLVVTPLLAVCKVMVDLEDPRVTKCRLILRA